MSKSGRAVSKLIAKDKVRGMRLHLGTFKGVLARTKSPFADKAVVFAEHKRAIHGIVRVGRDGQEIVVDPGGRNPLPVFDGTGLPDEVIKPAKTMAERAKADKRAPLNGEMVAGWKPRPYRTGAMLARGL